MVICGIGLLTKKASNVYTAKRLQLFIGMKSTTLKPEKNLDGFILKKWKQYESQTDSKRWIVILLTAILIQNCVMCTMIVGKLQ